MHNIQSPRADDDGVEQALKDLSAKLPTPGIRITPAELEYNILAEQYYVFPGTTVTVCCLTLCNGFNAIGESACIDPAMFNADIGKTVARDNAKQKLWALMGYALKERLHQTAKATVRVLGGV